MSETLIQSLQQQIERLQAEAATLRAEAKDRRIKGRALKTENEEYQAALADLAAERDRYKAAIEAEPHELQAQVDAYKSKLRDRDHKDKFRSLATKAGVTQDKALDDLWQLSGYKPDADEIDDGKITAAISSALTGRDWLKAATGAAAPNATSAGTGTRGAATATQETRSPGPGANRGAASGSGDPDAELAAKYPSASRLA